MEVGRETYSIIDQSRDATGGREKVEEEVEKAVLRTRLKGRTISKLIPSKTELVGAVEPNAILGRRHGNTGRPYCATQPGMSGPLREC